MPLLLLMGMVAASGISIILTMREARIETVRSILFFKALGIDLLLWMPLWGAYTMAYWH